MILPHGHSHDINQNEKLNSELCGIKWGQKILHKTCTNSHKLSIVMW